MRIIDIVEKSALQSALAKQEWTCFDNIRSEARALKNNYPVLGYAFKKASKRKTALNVIHIYISNTIADKMDLSPTDKIKIHHNKTESLSFIVNKDDGINLKSGYKVFRHKYFTKFSITVTHLNFKNLIYQKYIELEFQFFEDDKALLFDISKLFYNPNIGIKSE